jgi:two-component system cell cycle response regulator DivK
MGLVPPPGRRAKPTVLIVEDDEDLACAVGDALIDAGYAVVSAREGRQALTALELERPDLMLVDIFMPGMNGSELLRIVRSSPEWCRIPRIVMTGANDPIIGIRSDAAVIYKPLDLDALLALVARCCDRQPAYVPGDRTGTKRRSSHGR